MGKLDGKRALVTGGASGIGYAIAQLFLENGASTVIADLDGAKLAAARGELAAHGTVRAVEGDVRSMADAGRMVQAVVDEFGGLDVVVCNAGITSVTSIENLEEAEWDDVLATNVKGMFTVIKHAIPHLKSAGGGTIVTLGSEMAIVAVPESPAYNASKGAVVMFTKSLALDLVRYGIRVNALCPGITRTPLLQSEVDYSADPAKTAAEQATWAPMLRVADPREIATGALFLASDDSSFATGSCLVLDGGFTAR